MKYQSHGPARVDGAVEGHCSSSAIPHCTHCDAEPSDGEKSPDQTARRCCDCVWGRRWLVTTSSQEEEDKRCHCTAAALEDDAAKSIPTGWYGSTVSIYSEWRSNSSNSGVEVESHRNRRIESSRGRWLDDGGEDSLMVSSALTSTNMTRTVQFLLLQLFQCPFMWDQ